MRGAQFYPRHACPLYVSLFMQLHNARRARHGLSKGKRRMILHADTCTLCMHGSLQSGSPRKKLQKDKG